VRVARPNLAVRARDSYIYKPSATASGVIANTAKDNERQSTAPVLQKKFWLMYPLSAGYE
jgi:hypothetical protein